MHTERKLAAIMLADIAGYSGLMERDEGRTFERLRSLREHLVQPMVAKYQGRIIKTTGDGFLAEFASATAALRCGLELQRKNHAEQASLPADVRFHMRIGVNVGDIIMDGEDVSGDGVNIAARLEPLAPLDGLCVSAAIREQVREDLGVQFEDIGEQAVKNIARPIRAYRISLTTPSHKPVVRAKKPPKWAIAVLLLLLLAGSGWWGWQNFSVKSAIPDKGVSILVLPFTSIPADPKGNDFADSLTQDLTVSMARIRDSFVIDFLTSVTLRGKTVSMRDLGLTFKVRYVLTGSVRRDGERLRVTTQLISTETGGTLWTDQFDKPMADLFALQDEITANVASAVYSTIVTQEGQRSSHFRNHPEAYDLVAESRAAIYYSQSPESLRKVIERTTAAIALEPNTVDAWVYRSGAEAILALSLQGEERAAMIVQADSDAAQALALAPYYAFSHLARAYSYYVQNKLQAADDEYQKCSAADPSMAFCHASRGFMMPQFGRAAEAPAMIQRAIDLNPHSVLLHRMYYYMGDSYLYRDEPLKAIEWLQKAVTANPTVANYYVDLTAAYTETNHPEEARAALAKLRELSPTFTVARFLLNMVSDNATYKARRRDIGALLEKAGLPRE